MDVLLLQLLLGMGWWVCIINPRLQLVLLHIRLGLTFHSHHLPKLEIIIILPRIDQSGWWSSLWNISQPWCRMTKSRVVVLIIKYHCICHHSQIKWSWRVIKSQWATERVLFRTYLRNFHKIIIKMVGGGGVSWITKKCQKFRVKLINSLLKILSYMRCRMMIKGLEEVSIRDVLITIGSTMRRICAVHATIDRGGLRRLGFVSTLIRSIMHMGSA